MERRIANMEKNGQTKPSEILKRGREQKGLTQKEAAEEIGCDWKTYQRWEREGQIPQLPFRRKLAEIYGIDTQEWERTKDPPYNSEKQELIKEDRIDIDQPLTANSTQDSEALSILNSEPALVKQNAEELELVQKDVMDDSLQNPPNDRTQGAEALQELSREAVNSSEPQLHHQGTSSEKFGIHFEKSDETPDLLTSSEEFETPFQEFAAPPNPPEFSPQLHHQGTSSGESGIPFEKFPAPINNSPERMHQSKLSRRSILLGGGILAGLSLASGLVALSVRFHSGTNSQEPMPKVQTEPTSEPTATSAPFPLSNLYKRPLSGGSINDIKYLPDGNYLVLARGEYAVQVVSTSEATVLVRYLGHNGNVNAVSPSPDGALIASASSDQTVQIWQVTDGAHIFTYARHTGFVTSVAWSPRGRMLASGSYDATVQVWSPSSKTPEVTYRGHIGPIWWIAWSPDGNYLASGGNDSTVQVWEASTGKRIYTYTGHHSTIFTIMWSPDGKRIASAGEDQTVQIWDANTGQNPLTYGRHTATIHEASYSRNGAYIVSGAEDQTVQVWDANTGTYLTSYKHDDQVFSVVWSPDGTRISSGDLEGILQTWQKS